VLSRNPVAVEDVFAGLEDVIDIVQSATGDSWIPSLGINTLGDMQPGQGYKTALDVDTAVTFYYPAGSKNNETLSPSDPIKASSENNFFTCTETGLPWAVAITVKSPQESAYNLLPGDEIGLFDGNLCVGATVYQGEEQLLITAWEKDDMQGLPGFTPGETVEARVYSPATGRPLKYNLVDYSGNKPVFAQGNYADLVLETLPIAEYPSDFKLEVIPNPFKGNTVISFVLMRDDVVKVNLFDASGKMVRSFTDKKYAADRYRISWDGTDNNGKKLYPGIYFLTAETSNGVYIDKVVVLK
jgi:hypothetical protein